MAQNLQIDPETLDYVLLNGSPVESDRVEEAAAIALLIPLGGWLYGDTSQGSLVNQLEGVKRNGKIEQEFAAHAQSAILANVITQGKASAAQVANIRANRYSSINQVEVIPATTQLSQQLNFVPV